MFIVKRIGHMREIGTLAAALTICSLVTAAPSPVQAGRVDVDREPCTVALDDPGFAARAENVLPDPGFFAELSDARMDPGFWLLPASDDDDCPHERTSVEERPSPEPDVDPESTG